MVFQNLQHVKRIGAFPVIDAGIGKQNPGVELATFVLTVPLH